MNDALLQVKTLGGLCVKAGDRILLEQGARINKPWELLAFLLLNMDEPITNERICEALWEDGEVENPAGALKNAVYSLRKNLAEAGLPAACIIASTPASCLYTALKSRSTPASTRLVEIKRHFFPSCSRCLIFCRTRRLCLGYMEVDK